MSLTPNAVSGMFRMGGTADNPSFSPTVQVVHLKKIDNKSGADERWKVGSYFVMHCCALIGGCHVSPSHLFEEWIALPSRLAMHVEISLLAAFQHTLS